MMLPWKKKKLLKQLAENFGKLPDKDYYPGDMDRIRSYYDACRGSGKDPFYVDDTTWNDLDMDKVYRRINACHCTAGEQYLYCMLRRPMGREDWENQRGLIRLMEENPDTRTKLQLLLCRISNARNVDLTSAFHPKDSSPFWLAVYIGLVVLLMVSVILGIMFGQSFALLMVLSLILNVYVHESRRLKCEPEIIQVNYCVSLVLALNRIRKLNLPGTEPYLAEAYRHLEPMKKIIRSGPVMSKLNVDPLQGTTFAVFMTDLIAFEVLKKRLAKYHEHFLAVHEAVGRIDAAIAVASCRAGLETWCEPEIDFDADHPYIRAEGIVHPLLKDAVPNNLLPEKSMLITGSNASGKSTYLRTAVLTALTAQCLCTCACKSYAASPFRMYTSMALSDDLLSGESYFITEIKSLKRILDAQEKKGFLLCAIDEVLRGTNTIERISASTEILKALDKPGTLCLIATHDSELCTLSGGAYELAHFEETVSDTEILFDYRLKPGPAESRNAIHLLRLMGFDEAIVTAAHNRADRYEKTGKWE